VVLTQSHKKRVAHFWKQLTPFRLKHWPLISNAVTDDKEHNIESLYE